MTTTGSRFTTIIIIMNLLNKQLHELPNEIVTLVALAWWDIPVGTSQYQEAMDKYPEYFQEELEYRKKVEAVPKEVWDKYYEECSKLRATIYSNYPHPELQGLGIIETSRLWSEPETHKKIVENDEHTSKKLKEYEIEETKLYNKTFISYGLSK